MVVKIITLTQAYIQIWQKANRHRDVMRGVAECRQCDKQIEIGEKMVIRKRHSLPSASYHYECAKKVRLI